MKGILCLTIFVSATLAVCPNDDVTELWSDAATWGGVVPADGADLIITKPILLDTATASLGAVIIKDGGQLVFSPDHNVSLTADSVYIKDQGRMDIGSETCPYTSETVVTLTGTRTGAGDDTQPGENKFIAVGAGGALEIHGEQNRLQWTQLAETFAPKAMTYDTDVVGQAESQNHISFLEFDRNGTLIHRVDNIYTAAVMLSLIESTGIESIVMLAKYWGIHTSHIEDVSSIISMELLDGGACSLSSLENMQDAWALVVDKKTGTIIQDSDGLTVDDDDGANTNWLEVTSESHVFRVQSRTRKYNEINVHVYPGDFFDYSIPVIGDISSWRMGDEIVISSTDFDYTQAEEFTIIGIDGQNILINDKPEYTHFGSIYETVDMRAEVGLLTRNVKITAVLDGEPCTGYDLDECKLLADDGEDGLYGGHTIAFEGFKSYNIRGAELRFMGQTQIISRYPIHFHMAKDTRRDGKPPVIEGNSIRDSLSRCITVHGSHYVEIKNNVANNHWGHCIFLEDGGEKHTLIEGNLVLGTKKGELIQTDCQPTSYWITSPLTIVRNNVAAGAHEWDGNGFWWLFPDEPIGLSTGLGFYERHEAKRTPITEISGNRAHSNGRIGFAIFNRIGDEHQFIGCSTYEPRADPLDWRSLLVPVTISNLTAYKNKDINIRSRVRTSIWTDIHLAESRVGFHFYRNTFDGYQLLKDSVIVGDTPNIGNFFKWRRPTDGWLTYDAPRSLPRYWEPDMIISGVEIQAEGPSKLQNVVFKNFKHTWYRNETAIMWPDSHFHMNGASTSSEGLSFNYADPEEGFYMYENKDLAREADFSYSIRDLDGSLTGTAGTTSVYPGQYFEEGQTCATKDGWNMDVCEAMFAKVFLRHWFPNKYKDTFMIDRNTGDVIYNNDIVVSYDMVTGEDRYILNWNKTMDNRVFVNVLGLETGKSITVGFCLPMSFVEGIGDRQLRDFFDVEGSTCIKEAESFEALQNSTDLDVNTFLDREKGIFYRRFTEQRDRLDGQLGECAGELDNLNRCPYFYAKMWTVPDVDWNDGDCTQRLGF